MKSAFLLAIPTLLLASCKPHESVSTSPAVTTTPTAAEVPVVAPLVVQAAQIEEQDVAVLAGATWTTKQCALETPGDAIELPAAANGGTNFAGYFIDPSEAPAGDFDIVLKGTARNFRIPAKTGWDRLDVAEFFKIPALATSGYHVLATLAPTVPAGRYEVDFILERAGVKYFCESGKTLVIQ